MVRFLLKEDMETVYLKNTGEKFPLYLATDTKNPELHTRFYFLPRLNHPRYKGLAPIHGAAVHHNCGVETYLLDDQEEYGTASGTTTSPPPDGAGESHHG
ncbi:hypothetical protein NL676_000582 [Syzygium grande]|nr:hypothetical protein NL676_000582 [Syzygium grande]